MDSFRNVFGFALALVNNAYVVEIFAHVGEDLLDVRLALSLACLFKASAQCLKMNKAIGTADAFPSMSRSADCLKIFALACAVELIELVATILKKRRNQIFQIRIGTNDPCCR